MPEVTEIRRHPDGSIDIEHYVKVGRHIRGQAFSQAGRGVIARLRRLYRALTMRRHQIPRPAGGTVDVVSAE